MMCRKNMRSIQAVLRELGLSGRSVALRQLVCAVELAHEEQILLTRVYKGLYRRVAEEFGETNTTAVERNLRGIRDRVWDRGNMERLQEMAMVPIKLKPSTGELIDIIRYHMEINGLFPEG